MHNYLAPFRLKNSELMSDDEINATGSREGKESNSESYLKFKQIKEDSFKYTRKYSITLHWPSIQPSYIVQRTRLVS